MLDIRAHGATLRRRSIFLAPRTLLMCLIWRGRRGCWTRRALLLLELPRVASRFYLLAASRNRRPSSKHQPSLLVCPMLPRAGSVARSLILKILDNALTFYLLASVTAIQERWQNTLSANVFSLTAKLTNFSIVLAG